MRPGTRTDLQPQAPVPEVISQTDAAKMLGVSRQRKRTPVPITQSEAVARRHCGVLRCCFETFWLTIACGETGQSSVQEMNNKEQLDTMKNTNRVLT